MENYKIASYPPFSYDTSMNMEIFNTVGSWQHVGFTPFLGMASFATLIIIGAIWSLVWKGWAMWVAGRQGEKFWFVLFLLVNTFGILEMIYIFLIAKAHRRENREKHHLK